jgi:hypothetical protein
MTVPDLAMRYAALVALTDAIGGEKNKTSAELREALWAQGLTKGTVNTPLGPLTLRENKGGASVVITDEDALVGWCEANCPESIERITRVRPNDRGAIVGTRFVAVADDVVDSLSGELVPFAKVQREEQGPPTPSWGASPLQREAKRAAVEIAAIRCAPLVEALRMSVLELEPPDYDPMDGQ